MKLRRQEFQLTLPSLLWLLVFFALPCVLILALAFRPSDLRGGVGDGWTLDTIRQLTDAQYLPIIWRTIWFSAVTTVACLALSLPICWHMIRVSARWRSFLLLLAIIPFLTNFLIRVFAWKSLLHPEGFIKQWLVTFHLATDDTLLLNNAGAVLVVLVYTQLPFAILPLYAAAEKFEISLLDAARDLGATGAQAFRKVFVPGIRQGIVAAVVIVFVSSLGQYVIPQMVGGTGDEMIGNKISQRAFGDRNLPLASALSGALLLLVLIPTFWLSWRSRKEVVTE